MDIINIINFFVELELECGQLEGSLRSAQSGLYYAQGKGNGWEPSVDYASQQVNNVAEVFAQKRVQHQKLKAQYTDIAQRMSAAELATVLNYLGNAASKTSDYKSQAYGMVYNELHAIYKESLGHSRRF